MKEVYAGQTFLQIKLREMFGDQCPSTSPDQVQQMFRFLLEDQTTGHGGPQGNWSDGTKSHSLFFS